MCLIEHSVVSCQFPQATHQSDDLRTLLGGCGILIGANSSYPSCRRSRCGDLACRQRSHGSAMTGHRQLVEPHCCTGMLRSWLCDLLYAHIDCTAKVV